MSNTYAHRPPRCWLNDPRVCAEFHDHRTGPCELVSLERWRTLAAAELTRGLRCGWEPMWERLPNTCGCKLCTQRFERRAERRRARHDEARRLRTGGWRTEYEEV